MLGHLKEDVRGIARHAQRDGLCKYESGNFSARDAKSDYIVITPTSIDREMLTPRDMVVTDLDTNVLEHTSGLRLTSEALIHLMIYRARKDARAIVCTHSMYGTTFTLLNKSIPAIVYEVANFGPTKARIPIAPYGHPGTMELVGSVVEVCEEAKCFLLEECGTVAFDTRDIHEAYPRANYIEGLTQLYYNALTVHQEEELEAFSQEELQCWEYPKEISFADE